MDSRDIDIRKKQLDNGNNDNSYNEIKYNVK